MFRRFHRLRCLAPLVATLLLTGCMNPWDNVRNLFSRGGGGGGGQSPSTPQRVVEPTATFALAMGGVAPGRNELVFFDGNTPRAFPDGSSLTCTADPDIVDFSPRAGFTSLAAGSGPQLTPLDVGVARVECSLDGVPLPEVFEITIPPQSLIQVLLGEAAQQIGNEASIDRASGQVELSSRSHTAELLGEVIRNRVLLIEVDGNASLFNASQSMFFLDPPASSYDAVITAPNQFAPVATSDPSNALFTQAAARSALASQWLIAYDQAVLSAASVFNGDSEDDTGGAFAFRTPTADQWNLLNDALISGTRTMPINVGISDANFPAFAPVQALAHPDMGELSAGRPAFVLIRARQADEPAVSDVP